jgi:two-component sensor histidine kinase
MISRIRFLLWYFAAWTPFLVLYALILRQRAPLGAAIRSGFLAVGVAAVLGLGVRHFALRVVAHSPRWWRFLPAHAAMGTLYAALWTASIAGMIRVGAPASVWHTFLENAIWWQFIMGLALYGVVAGSVIALATSTRLREQRALAARAEVLRARAELRALRAQLNPHFLFNTLHSITALVRSDPRAAEDALERFGMLMRRVLEIERQQRDELLLAEELDFLRAYLALERIRLGDRLRVVEEIDSDTLDCYIPSFTLQPLVENAVRHGIAPLAGGGTLRLEATITDDRLHLEVADDGAGVDVAAVRASEGVGLQVVSQRLEARFAETARLDLTSALNEGFRAHITMPIVLHPLATGAASEYVTAQ